MRNLRIFALAGLVTLFVLATATYVLAGSPKEEVCKSTANIFYNVADNRDTISPSQSVRILVAMGYDLDVALNLVHHIYITKVNKSPEELAASFFNTCMSQKV